jgi:hypothetical protein
MDSKRVFILGAGFSKQTGMPLAAELTPLLIEKFKEYEQEEALSWFEELNETMNWLEGAGGGKSTKINIEEVFDLAYFDVLRWRMEQQRCPLGRNDGSGTPWNQAESINAWLEQMEDDLRDVIWEGQQAGKNKMEGIRRYTQNLREDDVILTFNYDTLIEKTLTEFKIPWSYGFSQEKREGTVILKMHGSINWAIVPRNQVGSFGYPLLFRKEDQNVENTAPKPTGEIEYDYVLLQLPDDNLDSRIKNRILQWSNKQYSIGIAGLGRYKPLDRIPGSGQVWHNAGRALYQADEIYIVGFSLSPFDTMARLHFAGVMCERAKKKNLPTMIMLIDPNACKLKADFQSVFGADTPITLYKHKAEKVNWSELLCN